MEKSDFTAVGELFTAARDVLHAFDEIPVTETVGNPQLKPLREAMVKLRLAHRHIVREGY